MIASHDTWTFEDPECKITTLAKGVWKTQELDELDQVDLGVRYFDFRVQYTKKGIKLCHGLVNFTSWSGLRYVCDFVEGLYPACKYRIILEKGNKADEERFEKEIKELLSEYPNLDWAVIKKDWKTIKHTNYKIVDYCCKLNTAKDVLNLAKYGFSIKNWCKKNNPKITEEMIKDKNTVYFYDYVNIQNN